MGNNDIKMCEEMETRVEELREAAHRFCQFLAKYDDQVKNLPMDDELLQRLIYFAREGLERHGMHVCVPDIYEVGGIKFRCTIAECGCRECYCQREPMQREWLMARIAELLELYKWQVKESIDNNITVCDKGDNTQFVIRVDQLTTNSNLPQKNCED